MFSSVVRDKNSTHALLKFLFWTLIVSFFIVHNESVDNHVLLFVRMFTFAPYFYVEKAIFLIRMALKTLIIDSLSIQAN